MENKWGDIKAYMAKNDLSFKSLDNVKKAVVYYNAAQ
jgi:hypothetical protein